MSFDVGQYGIPSDYTSSTAKSLGAIRVHTLAIGNNRGSTNTFIPCFEYIIQKEGTSITWVRDFVKGDYFVINESGVYNMMYSDGDGPGNKWGITVDLNAADQAAGGIAAVVDKSKILVYQHNVGGFVVSMSVGAALRAGSIVRPMADAGVGLEDQQVRFSICRVS